MLASNRLMRLALEVVQARNERLAEDTWQQETRARLNIMSAADG